jgi:hypothetical protein
MRTHKQPSRVVPVRVPPGAVPEPDLADVDPTDPVQQLDEAQDFHIEPLEVNVMPEAERQDDVDAAIGIAEADEDEDDEDTFDLDSGAVTSEDRTAKADDVGELYGVHLPPAQDRERGAGPEHGEYAESELGENWLETLGGETAEGGPVPEHEVDPNDDSDYRGGHHATESGDRPVADKGSGGPGGL